jgi:hypothetical protein
MFTIENRTQSPRVFITRSGASAVVGVGRKAEVDIDQASADYIKEMIEAENAIMEANGHGPDAFKLSITGSAEKSKRVRLSDSHVGQTDPEDEGGELLEDEGEEEAAPRSRRKPAKAKPAKKAASKRGGRKSAKSAAADEAPAGDEG